MIKVEKINKTYVNGGTELRVLKDVSFEVEQGDFLAIMGSSGSGKSTMMNILGCLDSEYEGQYLLEGIDISKMNEKGNGGGHIVFSENKMIFAGSTVIKPSDNPADVEKNKDKIEKAKLKEFSNPKIVEENGKKYIKADGLDYKLVLENDNTIKDLDDNIEYVNVDTNSKEKK